MMLALPGQEPALPVVLLAEDSAHDRLILEEVFQEAGIAAQLRFVEDGEELLDYLKQRGAYAAGASVAPWPAVVLLDINMPKVNGHEAVRAIRADPLLRDLPVVALSTSDSPKQIALAYSLGVNSFLTKPARFASFVELMRMFGNYWLQGVRLPPQRS
ncbi:response regulator [Paeniroseomonas aquatica]|uniref:Response regulator n=1 Tax=Paeniroseomonas aquatica TaxID=373043 RepID=A0ABT8A9C8_9PROT|nr:response regulator [Paeniroseomonas aquatica]MDN3566409.1 response regulator [Paeniroseomonas aquatica]